MGVFQHQILMIWILKVIMVLWMKTHLLDKLLKSSVEKGDVQGVAAIISNENDFSTQQDLE